MTQLKVVSLATAKASISLVKNLSHSLIHYCIACILLLLTACSGLQTLGISVQDGPGQSVNINAIRDAVPKVEPITRAGNKSPYTQFGVTYHVLPSSQGFRETGIASWYGSKFHGRRTSNGEIYDMYAMTAAHKTLPIPSYVRVTNQENRLSIVVRVNDRGPFHESRIIDLSYVAALKLGFAAKGTAKVSVEALDPYTGIVSTPIANQINGSSSVPLKAGQYLQAGAFQNSQSAKRLADQIAKTLAIAVSVKQTDQIFKVWMGPFRNDNELQSAKQHLKQRLNISTFTVKK